MKLIDFLLRLYPGEFRDRYGKQMREFHDERMRENAGLPRIVGDHVTSAMAEQVQSVRPDVSFALRGMLRRPGFAAVIIVTIALGVGANAAIFSVVKGILFRPLPYRDVDRVVAFTHESPQWLVAEPQYATYRDKARSFASLATWSPGEVNIETKSEPLRVAFAGVSNNFFATLGVRPMLGRTFVAGDDAARPFQVIVLSHDVWEHNFNADSAIVGGKVVLNGVPRTVIGVMPPRFEYPTKGTKLWMPACSQRTCASLTTLQPDPLDGWATHYLFLVGRLRDGFSIEQARSETNLLARQIMRDHPGSFNPATPLTPKIAPLRENLVGTTRPYLYALLGAVGVVLLVVCANVASLLLARGESRRREMSLRAALGASRRRLVTQLLTEAIVLALVGGLAGVALAVAASRGIVALAPASLPRLDEIRVDWLVVTFGIVVSCVAGIVFGIAPALRASREDPADALKSGGKGASAGSSSTRARRVLVVSEVALAVVLLSGAGMLVRSLVHLHRQDLGFDAASVLTAKVSPSGSRYTDTTTMQFWAQLAERARALPGVEAAGAVRWLPVVDQGGSWSIAVDAKDFARGDFHVAVPQEVTPGSFAAMGIKLLEGRDLNDADRASTQLVGVISSSLAKKYWPNEPALGKRLRYDGLDTTRWVTVVGVVSDIRQRGFQDVPEPTMYVAHQQSSRGSYFVPRSMTLVVRARPGTDPMMLANATRAVVRELDPTIPVSSVRTLESVVGTSTANRRFSTALIAGFALLALVLAGIGIYGVISYAVSERTFEIGVRVALGADRGNVMGLVVGDGVKLALAGITIGVAGSVLLARGIRSLLVDAPAIDVLTLGGVALVLGVVAVGASALPARRATSVSPTEALRSG